MKKIAVVALVAALSMLTACGESGHTESCEWEQKKKSKSLNTVVLPELVGKVGGSSGGRGGGSGSRSGSSGSRGSSSSSGGSGGASKPRYNKSSPAPAPKTPAKSGYVWKWDCE